MGSLFADDRNWIGAGIVAAVAIPLLVFVAGLPFALALVAGLVVFVGLILLLSPRRLFEGIDVSKVGRARLDLTRKVLADALPKVERLREMATRIQKPTVSAQVARLAATAQAIVAGVEKDPTRLGAVQRFLTYYLPAAGDLAENYAVLEQKRTPEAGRIAQAEAVIGKLDEAFSHYADSLLESDLSDLDVELRLIESSLKEDLGGAR